MDFVALISGGKDSIYTILECIRAGHRLVAVANLYPAPLADASTADEGAGTVADSVPVELNSYMLQTVGHTAIESIAKCLNKPLYRQQTHGKSIQSGLQYSTPPRGTISAERDEVEDMFEVLERVKIAHPSISAVACGAVLSNYQRLRVENVAKRLGWVSLAYLWQRDQSQLLQEMIDSEINAVLVKVASYGLTTRMLGQNISQLQKKFESLKLECGLNVCGEGGEYESLVLDCPLFETEKVVVLKQQIVHVDRNEIAPVAHLDVECTTEAKVLQQQAVHVDRNEIAPVAHLDVECTTEAKAITTLPHKPAKIAISVPKEPANAGIMACARRYAGGCCVNLAVAQSDRWFHCNAITITTISADFIETLRRDVPDISTNLCSSDATVAVSTQTHVILSALREYFDEVMCVSLADVVFVHVYLADMSLFAAMNDAYCCYFGENPPSRSCVAVNGPLMCDAAVGEVKPLVMLDVIGRKHSYHAAAVGDNSVRSTLHVRSLSKWAPVCIGPYCQASVLNEDICLVAGQIALQPETMLMEVNDLRVQMERALRNCANILQCLRSDLSRAVSLVVYVSAARMRDAGIASAATMAADVRRFVESFCVTMMHPIVTVVFVAQLPRDAMVEIEVVGATQSCALSYSAETHAMTARSDSSRVYTSRWAVVPEAMLADSAKIESPEGDVSPLQRLLQEAVGSATTPSTAITHIRVYCNSGDCKRYERTVSCVSAALKASLPTRPSVTFVPTSYDTNADLHTEALDIAAHLHIFQVEDA